MQIRCLAWAILPIATVLVASALAGSQTVPVEAARQLPAVAGPPPGSAKAKPRLDPFGDALPPGALYRIGTRRLQLTQGIGAIAASPDGKLVAALGTDTLAVWETSNGREICRVSFKSATDSRVLAFSPDGKSLACNCEGKLSLFDLASAQIRKTLGDPGLHAAFVREGEDSLTTVSWAAAGIAAIRCWDVATGKLVRRSDIGTPPDNGLSPTLKGIALSADGRVVCALESDWLDPSKENQIARLFNVATGAELHRWQLGEPAEPTLVLSSDGKLVAARIKSSALVRIWESASGKELGSCKSVPLGSALPTNGPLAFAPDGASLLCSGRAGLTRWDWRSGKQIREYRGATDPVAFVAGGKVMAVQTWPRKVRLLDVETGKDLCPLPRPGNQVAFSSDCRLAAWTDDDAVVLADAVSGKELRRWQAEALPEYPLVFAPDGRSLVSVGNGYRIYLWDVASGQKIRQFGTRDQQNWAHWLFFSSDGRRLTSGNDREACVFDVDSGDLLGRWQGAVVSPSVQTVAVTDQKAHKLRLIDPATGKTTCELPGYSDRIGSLLQTYAVVGDRVLTSTHKTTGSVHPLFSPDGRMLLVPGESAEKPDLGALYLWDVATGKRLPLLLHGDTVNLHSLTISRDGHFQGWSGCNLIFSADGRLLAGVRSDGRIGLLSTATGKFVRMLSEGQSMPPVFTPDGRTVVTVLGGSIQFWEVATGRQINVRDPFQGEVRKMFVSADSRRLATVLTNDTILVWDLAHLATDSPPAPIALESLWTDLASLDAAIGLRCVESLSAVPAEAVPLLRARITPVPAASPQQFGRWIADLGSDDFELRQQSEKELDRQGEAAGTPLRDAFATSLPLESRRRIEGLLKNLDQWVLSSDQVRVVRAIQVLEAIGSPEAQAVLETLAGGAPDAGEIRDARAALVRLKKRGAVGPGG